MIQELFARGYDSIVAVNTELEFRRDLRPGELVSNVETLDDVSPLKHTARGPGYFVTTRHRFTNQRDEHVGDLMFRILLFDSHPPEALPGDTAGPTPATGPSPTPGPSLHKRPRAVTPGPSLPPTQTLPCGHLRPTADNRFFWHGVARHELRIQRCTGLRTPSHASRPEMPGLRVLRVGLDRRLGTRPLSAAVRSTQKGRVSRTR